ncbi:MAG: helix-turn-helix domain-containing protein, partial [Bacteroidota bacterium]
NKDLLHEIEQANFREDLYHRLSVILVHVPPLRERKDDIPLIAGSFIKEIAGDYGMPDLRVTSEGMHELQRLDWTGNVRELRNVMERLAILSNGEISAQDVMDFAVPKKRKAKSISVYDEFDKFQEFKDHVEKSFILQKLEQNNWNISKTAELLDIQRSHLYNKMDKFDIKRDN